MSRWEMETERSEGAAGRFPAFWVMLLHPGLGQGLPATSQGTLPHEIFPTGWRCHCPLLELQVLCFKYIPCLLWHWRLNQRAISHRWFMVSLHSPYPIYQNISTFIESGGKSTPKRHDSIYPRAPVLVPAPKCPGLGSEATLLTLCLLVWA